MTGADAVHAGGADAVHAGALPAGLRVDPASAVAPYEQLRRGVIEATADGRLAAGSRLPTVRALAESLGVAPGTVARAYKELEADGFVETRGRAGTFVQAQGDRVERAAQEAAAAYADRIRALGVPADRALEYVRRALGA